MFEGDSRNKNYKDYNQFSYKNQADIRCLTARLVYDKLFLLAFSTDQFPNVAGSLIYTQSIFDPPPTRVAPISSFYHVIENIILELTHWPILNKRDPQGEPVKRAHNFFCWLNLKPNFKDQFSYRRSASLLKSHNIKVNWPRIGSFRNRTGTDLKANSDRALGKKKSFWLSRSWQASSQLAKPIRFFKIFWAN